MSAGMNEKLLNTIAASTCIAAFVSAFIRWQEQLQPLAAPIDGLSGLIFGAAFFMRQRLRPETRTLMITFGALLIGVFSIYYNGTHAPGYVALCSLMVLTFTYLQGWKAWVLPVASSAAVALTGLGVATGHLDFEGPTSPNSNSPVLWLLTAMAVAIAALTMGGAINAFKGRLTRQLNRLAKVNEKLYQSAYTDPITGLANRQRLEEVIDNSLELREPGSLLVMDLTNFRLYNALHGHVEGDAVLLKLAQLLRQTAPQSFVIARLPGAQFGVWTPGADLAPAEEFFQRVARSFETLAGQTFGLGLSAGLVQTHTTGDTFQRLIQCAEVAIADAKSRRGSVCSLFTPAMASSIEAANLLKQKVRQALDQDGFHPVYQMKVNARSGDVTGFEGLARMRTQSDEAAPGPCEFIPVIHEEGWMTEFGALMLRAVLHDVPLLVKRFGANIKVSVNVSPPLFLAPEFLPLLKSCLSDTHARADNLVIEITEEVFASNLQNILDVTHQIRALGVEVSLDDFGSGFSSLSYLREVRFDEIKIDRAFVQTIVDDEKTGILFSSIMRLGLELGSRMVAEGVETQAQAEQVQKAGCDIIQGFYYSHPIPLDEVLQKKLHLDIDQDDAAEVREVETMVSKRFPHLDDRAR